MSDAFTGLKNRYALDDIARHIQHKEKHGTTNVLD